MKTVIGLFDDSTAAQSAITALSARNIPQADISVVTRGSEGGAASDVDAAGQNGERQQAMQDSAKNGAGAGAVVGTGIGGTIGLLAGLGTIVIPGVGPILAAGPLLALLAGAGVGAAAGAAVGGLVGALTKIGVPEQDAHLYAEGVRRGGTLVHVRASDDLAGEVADIMTQHGAVDVDKRREHYEKSGFKGHDVAAPAYSTEQIAREREAVRTHESSRTSRVAGDAEVTVPVVEESLKVGKRRIEQGGIRVYTEVTEVPVQEQVTLREQHAVVSRHAVDRPVTAADTTAFKEQHFEVREFAEEAVIAKEARVVEEVTIRRETGERTETINETVRRSEVEVEQIDDDAKITSPRVPPVPKPAR